MFGRWRNAFWNLTLYLRWLFKFNILSICAYSSFLSATTICDDDNECHANGVCANKSDSRICVCKEGFVGDGIQCNGNGMVYIIYRY